jgi:glutaredoxin-like protein
MPLLKDKDRDLLKDKLAKELAAPVKLLFFTQELECETCQITRQLAEEVAALSDKIELVTYNFAVDKEPVAKYGIDKIPALVIAGDKDYGLRYYGVPSGYEFTSLIEDIVDVSRRSNRLSPKTKEALQKVANPVHIQVFVTPT